MIESLAVNEQLGRAEMISDEWLRANCEEFFHAAGTCLMGDSNDPRAVVQHDARVIGVEGLGVADASIIPALPHAAPHLTTVMIAEHLTTSLIAE